VSATDDLLANNEEYVRVFGAGDKAKAPAKKVAVLACMDARLDPARILGLEIGDAHVIRNAGGVVTDDAIRSLAISQHLLGTGEIVLIQHTDCGMAQATDEEITALLATHAGLWPPFKPLTFSNLERNLRESIKALKESPFLLKRDQVSGFVYDVKTGGLTEVS
jgi:carbonic anhydrase